MYNFFIFLWYFLAKVYIEHIGIHCLGKIHNWIYLHREENKNYDYPLLLAIRYPPSAEFLSIIHIVNLYVYTGWANDGMSATVRPPQQKVLWSGAGWTISW